MTDTIESGDELNTKRLWRCAAVATAIACSYNVNATSDFDIDGNGVVEVKTDGLLVLRYMLGFRGAALIAAAAMTSPAPASSIAAAIETFLVVNTYDLDGNGSTSASTDGMLLARYLLGQTNGALTQRAIGAGSPRRPTGALVAGYILNGCSVTPPVTPGRPNDTAILFDGSFPTGNSVACAGEPPTLQDCAMGHDANGALVKMGDGGAGFDLTKIGNGGQALPASAALGTAAPELGMHPRQCHGAHLGGQDWQRPSRDVAHLIMVRQQ